MPIKITRVLEVADFGDKGQTIPSVRVEFNVGPHGPFSVTIAKKDFNATVANQKVNEFAQHVQQLQGVA
jgi:hypothetical protein